MTSLRIGFAALVVSGLLGAAPALASGTQPGAPARSTHEDSQGTRPRPKAPLLVGFAANASFQQTLQQALRDQGHSAVGRAGEVSATPGVVVGGIDLQAQREGEWLSCRVKYFVAAQASAEVLRVDSAAASVALMQVKLFQEQPARAQLAEEDCYKQLAQQVAARITPLEDGGHGPKPTA